MVTLCWKRHMTAGKMNKSSMNDKCWRDMMIYKPDNHSIVIHFILKYILFFIFSSHILHCDSVRGMYVSNFAFFIWNKLHFSDIQWEIRNENMRIFSFISIAICLNNDDKCVVLFRRFDSLLWNLKNFQINHFSTRIDFQQHESGI